MILAYIYLALSLAGLSLTIWGALLGFKHFYVQRNRKLKLKSPVTILKPLKGLDSDLPDNLKSFFEMDYPQYQIILSVDHESDPATNIARELIEAYPHKDATLIVGDKKVGLNPKINNMIRGYQDAKYDHILISDSNVRVKPDYLKHMVSSLQGKVGVVTSVIVGKHAHGLGGQLEATYLNTFYAKSMFLAKRFGHSCVIGKSMLFRKSTAERFGGLASLKNYLAEDYMFGLATQRLGYKVAYAAKPVTQHIGHYTFKDFWSRHLRWGRIRKSHAPFAVAIEPLLSSAFFDASLFSYAASEICLISPLRAFILYFFIWGILDHMVHFALRRKIKPFYPLVWILREMMFLPLWIHTVMGQTVNWRGTIYKLKQGGLLEEQGPTQRISLWHKIKQKISYGALLPAVTKSKVKTPIMTGGIGNKTTTLKVAPHQETPATTGTDTKTTSNSQNP